MKFLATIILANCTLYGQVEIISPNQCTVVALPYGTQPHPPPLIINETNNGTIILIEDPYNETQTK